MGNHCARRAEFLRREDLKNRQVVEIQSSQHGGWKQAIWYGSGGEGEFRSTPQVYKSGKTHYVEDIIPLNEVKAIRRPMLLVRAFECFYGHMPDELQALKQCGSHGRNFVSASVVEAQNFTTFGGRSGSRTNLLVMDLSPCTNIYGGSSHNLRSGFHDRKDLMDMNSDSTIGTYLQSMNLQCVERSTAERYNLRRGEVFEDVERLSMCRRIADMTNRFQHNELLIQLHNAMVWGLLLPEGAANSVTLVTQFEEALGRRPFVVQQIGKDFIVNDDPELTKMVKIIQ